MSSSVQFVNGLCFLVCIFFALAFFSLLFWCSICCWSCEGFTLSISLKFKSEQPSNEDCLGSQKLMPNHKPNIIYTHVCDTRNFDCRMWHNKCQQTWQSSWAYWAAIFIAPSPTSTSINSWTTAKWIATWNESELYRMKNDCTNIQFDCEYYCLLEMCERQQIHLNRMRNRTRDAGGGGGVISQFLAGR